MAKKEPVYSSYGRQIKPTRKIAEASFQRDIEREISRLEEEISRIEDACMSRSLGTPSRAVIQPTHATSTLTRVLTRPQRATTSTPVLRPAQATHATAPTVTPVRTHSQYGATSPPALVPTQATHPTAPTDTPVLTHSQYGATSPPALAPTQATHPTAPTDTPVLTHSLHGAVSTSVLMPTQTKHPTTPILARALAPPQRTATSTPVLMPSQAMHPTAQTPIHVSTQPQHVAASTPVLMPTQPTHTTVLTQPRITSTPTYSPTHEPEQLVYAAEPTPTHVSTLNTQAPVFTPTHASGDLHGRTSTQVEHSTTDETLAKLVNLLDQTTNRLPQMEPDTFSDDMLNFPVWLKSFETLIESRAKSERERLFYLGKYTAGDARQAIQGYLMLGGNDAYVEAKATLVRRYGDKYKLAQRFKEKLNAWPVIKTGDGEAMMKLADFLDQCLSAMTSIHHLDSLNNAEETMRILEKLPRHMMDRWRRTVDGWLYGEEGRYPPFSVFVRFIEMEARIANGPCSVFSKQPSESYKSRDRNNNVRAFATRGEENASAPQVPDNEDSKAPYCYACKGSHHISKCNEFKAMNIDSRRDIAKAKGLCFSCLHRGHLRRDCQRQGAPLLYVREDTESDIEPRPVISHKTHCPQQQPGLLHTMIVPVVLFDPNTNKKVTTYALLDNQSNASFITNSLSRIFGTSNETDLRLTTMSDERIVKSKTVCGLVVRGIKEETEIDLPVLYSRNEIPVNKDLIPRPETAALWPHLARVAEELQPYKDMQVGLLIGFNCSAALLPRKVEAAGDNEPYAIKTVLGWSVTGNMTPSSSRNDVTPDGRNHFTFRTQVQEISPVQISQMFQHEFNEKVEEKKVSIEDKRFLEQMNDMYQREDSHFELPLPLKNPISLPNNRELAVQRFGGLKTKLKKNQQFREDYIKFMKNNIDKGYAEKVPVYDVNKTSGHVWYIPHHGVYHPRKPGKIRVVFDCSAEYKGESLNKHLLQGPDLTSNLAGILLRFRQEHVAITCDIEGMFHQVSVFPSHRDLLRFLWFEDENLYGDPVDYRMTVHLFGAASSPGCANYALKKTADMYEKEYGSEASNFIRQNFYVDDGLRSVASREEAKKLINDAHNMCQRGGFNLHKFICSDREVLATIPTEHQEKTFQNLDLSCDSLPTTRTLGVLWHIENDEFRFKVDVKEKPITRRGILSTVSSIYDPLGFVSPMLLPGRKLLQEICTDGCNWDDPVDDDIKERWMMWKNELHWLTGVRIQRCYKPRHFTNYTAELHHFSDASAEGYGQCSYLRLVNDNDVCTALVMGKSRVAPSKHVTIPRLELTAAVLSAKVAAFLDRELEYKVKHVFWTDSMVVLGYIANESKRFHVYVANRVQQIRDFSDPSQWNYVSTDENPADLASRGMNAQDLKDSKLWWHGPDFLKGSTLPTWNIDDTLALDDPEVKVTVHATQTKKSEPFDIDQLLTPFSSWHQAKRAVAVCLRYMKKLKARMTERKPETTDVKERYNPVNTEEMQRAEIVIVKELQKKALPQERQCLLNQGYPNNRLDANKRNNKLKQTSILFRLDPFMTDDELIRVGGRVKRANIPHSLAHPVILPKDGYVTQLLIRHFHERTNHSGMNTTLNEVRSSGFWVLKARTVISSIINKCVTCKRLYGRPIGQKMADLPADRLEPAPPFTYTGVDFFGPFYVKEGRSERKRWGALFTCLVSRAIHIEVAHSLSTDSFLNAYRRFIGRRGPVRQLRCDRGTNFVGARNELHAARSELDHQKVKRQLLKDECDWVEFKMNVPHASHMGGAWERMIRSVRRILSALLDQHGHQLDDELLHTLLIEAETVINSRPLTYQDTKSPDAQEPLTPNHILTLKSKVVYPPPGLFVKEDLYCRKRWRRVQYLANEFWTRWKREYLSTLQERKKWPTCRENVKVGDIVLVSDDGTPRCQWPLAMVTDVSLSEDSLVRKVTLKTANSTLERPVHKLVRVHRPVSEPGNPDVGASDVDYGLCV